jgi:hypothetical protein
MREERTYDSLLPLCRDQLRPLRAASITTIASARRGKPHADQPSLNNVRWSRNLDCNCRRRRSRSFLWPGSSD